MNPNLQGASYQIWSKEPDPQLLAEGTIDRVGRTARLFTDEPKELEFIVGENEWFTVQDDECTYFFGDDDLDSDDAGNAI